MTVEPQATGWIVTAYQAWVGLWIWTGLILVYALWRGIAGPETDPIRPAGPVE